ncbi:MAG TPA: hypothetical protein VEL11_11405 [Candidatus Bathyarchaeia archaeon]|nr:hypothetical protein [Candidatus Bathyarchaeia archaeon]
MMFEIISPCPKKITTITDTYAALDIGPNNSSVRIEENWEANELKIKNQVDSVLKFKY